MASMPALGTRQQPQPKGAAAIRAGDLALVLVDVEVDFRMAERAAAAVARDFQRMGLAHLEILVDGIIGVGRTGHDRVSR